MNFANELILLSKTFYNIFEFIVLIKLIYLGDSLFIGLKF